MRAAVGTGEARQFKQEEGEFGILVHCCKHEGLFFSVNATD